MAQITLNSSGVASNGSLALQSNGTTTAVTIDTSQNVGIGEASPTTRLDVKAAQGRIKLTSSTGTNNALVLFNNTGGNAYVGLDSSAGSLTSAYALNFYHEGAYPITFSTNSAERVRIESGGAVVIARTSNLGYSEKLTVGGVIATNGSQFNMVPGADFEFVQRSAFKMIFYVNAATVVANLSITGVWTNASDARYKENITDSPYGLAAVMALKPRAYNLINLTDKPQIGFIAQEVLEVVPEVVESVHNSVTDEDRYTLSYGNMVAVLTKAIQEQQAIIQTLTDRITALEAK